MPDPTTEGMRLDQIERARREKQRAEQADEPAAEKSGPRRVGSRR